MISNRCARKSLVTNCNSIISKNYLQLLVDSNDGTDKYKSIFGNDEAADIKSVMQNYGDTQERQQVIGTWLCDYANSRKPFDEIKNRQTYKEVADVANGTYDWKIERGQKGGIKM